MGISTAQSRNSGFRIAGTTKTRTVLRQVKLGRDSMYPCTHWRVRAMTATASSRPIPVPARTGEAIAVSANQNAATAANPPFRLPREDPDEPTVGPDAFPLA
ncbi:MAG: hypothetical protein F4Z21_07635 [Acidobacteria bacterium]|nr:hypothetical protein [Acidobacteriota bacterium]